ncbi:MAG: tRNA (guanosine(46)-N7)-methyltransferase TrmB [Firmicutes bacterium]|nr:tRNA (guanosine(46)-N7)-methyltransferase TrmB [Bacillota bacterium]
MRQRKIKNVEEKMAAYERWLVRDPEETRGRWRERFGCAGAGDGGSAPSEAGSEARKRLYLEIGAGKGQFITRMALNDPEALFVAAEGLASIVYRALEKADELGPENLLFIPEYLNGTRAAFAPGELDGVFLNFSDPWPKARNSKRRLTHAERLASYAESLAPGGFIKIKTDNDELFDFTLEQAENCMETAGLTIAAVTRDLHSSPRTEGYASTEYEDKFIAAGKNINYLELRKDH